MSNIIDTALAEARKIANLIEPAFALVSIAQSLTGLGGPVAATAIKVLDAAVKSFAAAAEGKITSAQALAELDKLKAMLVTNDAAADAALRARFPGP